MGIEDEKYNEMDDNVMANLYLALADSVLLSIDEKTTAKDIWDTLKNLYEAKTFYNKIFLKRKLILIG